MKRKISFTLNGTLEEKEFEESAMLPEVLRDDFEITGTRGGCGQGECGACMVIIDRKAVTSYRYPVIEIGGKELITIEGLLGKKQRLAPVTAILSG